MADFQRQYPLLSQCGLNCGLCPRYHTEGSSRCPGCGGEGFFAKRPSCGVISCARRHGGVEYCFLCEEYPCKKYEEADLYDSFISHQKMFADFERAKQDGIEAYRKELDEKVAVLRVLLEEYNDGRRKSFFCTAVNLLDLSDVREIVATLKRGGDEGMDMKQKAAWAVGLFEEMAKKRDISLELKTKKKAK